MAAALTSVQRTFLEAYVTGPLPEGSGEALDTATFERKWSAARDNWQKAEEAVGAQISDLQSAFRGSGVEVLQDIANTGLPALTGNTRTRALAAIFEIDKIKSNPTEKTLQRAEKRLSDLRAQLSSNPQVKACDENPFGIRVSISATLGGALDELRRTLRAGVQE